MTNDEPQADADADNETETAGPPRFHLAARIPAELAADARSLIAKVRSSPAPQEHRDEGVRLIQRLTKTGLDAYFLDGVKRLRLGFVAESITRAGLSTSYGALSMLIRRLAGGMNDDQMRRLADLVDEMVLGPHSGETD